MTDLPPHRAEIIKAGMTAIQQAEAEREGLRAELREAKESLARKNIELESMQQLNNMLESHINSSTMQRDDAVSTTAALETVLISILVQLRQFVETRDAKTPINAGTGDKSSNGSRLTERLELLNKVPSA
jgi:chromosome segregation ATPase